MPATLDRTVREIAIENPASIRVFESVGIDYCCGGKRPLSEACSRANVEVNQVLDLIAKADSRDGDAEDWTGRPLSDLIAHIVGKHHVYVQQEIPRLGALLLKVTSKHGPAHPETVEIQAAFNDLSQELLSHLRKEENILFPCIARLEQAKLTGSAVGGGCFGSVQQPISVMVAEHDDAGTLLAKIQKLSDDYTAPREACPTFLGLYRGLEDFERDLHRHIHLENNILFPRAIELEQAR